MSRAWRVVIGLLSVSGGLRPLSTQARVGESGAGMRGGPAGGGWCACEER